MSDRLLGEGDTWHLNSLLLKDGELCISAFGKFDRHRAWSDDSKEGAGFVINLATGEDVIAGLTCPHHPSYVGGAWVVCNSGKRELVQFDPAPGVISRRLVLRTWTRGIAFCDEVFFVGESANCQDADAGAVASIAVVSRRTREVVDRIALPCREVYDLVPVRRSLLEGVHRGFRTNPQRVAEADHYALFSRIGVQRVRFWAVGDPLPPEACRVRIEADLPTALDADCVVDVECSVENLGGAFLVSAPPNPVCLSYRWIDPMSGLSLPDTEGLRTAFPQTLLPGESLTCTMKIRTPLQSGEFLLKVTLVQELVAWFDDLNDRNCQSQLVRVMVKGAVSAEDHGRLIVEN